VNQTDLILIIEDDFNTGQSIKLTLNFCGYASEVCQDLNDAMSIMQKRPPSLVLMDYWLNNDSVSSLSFFLKKFFSHKKIPLILMSGDSQIKTIAQQLNVDSFISKPFDIDQLISIIEDSLQENIMPRSVC
jgi:DNA-binding NtrC family response regulator